MRPLIICLALIINIICQISHAYSTTLTTADVLKQTQIKAIAAPQLIFNRHSGITMNGIFDMGLNENSEIRALFGLGSIDFHFGGFYKWAPVPNTEKQPALGVLIGSTYASINGSSEFSLKVTPIISKNINIKGEDITPYASLPTGVTLHGDGNFVPLQVAIGSEWHPSNLSKKNLNFFCELGINLNNSFSYLTVGAAFYINDFLFQKVPIKTVR